MIRGNNMTTVFPQLRKDQDYRLKSHHFKSLLPFPAWGVGNVSPVFSPISP
jgi:hypothetical protein